MQSVPSAHAIRPSLRTSTPLALARRALAGQGPEGIASTAACFRVCRWRRLADHATSGGLTQALLRSSGQAPRTNRPAVL